MNKSRTQKIIVLLGPTSSGKSALSVKLAKKLALSKIEGFNGAEIISADSRQVYKGLNLASGKITKKDARGVPHHCLDVASPKTHYSVVQFKRCAKKALAEIQKKGKVPFVVGGTAFYIKALTDNQTIPEVPADWRLRRKLEKKSAEELFRMLKKLDPRRARTIEAKNKRRLIRAIEIVKTTGKPVPRSQSFTPQALQYINVLKYSKNTAILFMGIKIDEKTLKKKIEKRLDERLKKGMMAEIKKLHDKGVSWRRLDGLGLEPRWISRFLRGKITKEEMREKLLRDIFRFARHQYAWWKRDKRIHWIRSRKEADRYIKKIPFLKGIQWYT